MNSGKFLALVVFALLILGIHSLSGGGIAWAANSQVAIALNGVCKGDSGIFADDAFALVNGEYRGQIRCVTSGSSFSKAECKGASGSYKWIQVSSNSFTSQDSCAADCKNNQNSNQFCTEPRLVVWAESGNSGSGQTVADGASAPMPSSFSISNGNVIIIKSANENSHQNKLTKGSRSLQHVIRYQIVRGSSKIPGSGGCGESTSCSRTLYAEDLQPGDRIEYWAEISLEETNGATTYIRSPSPPDYSRDYKYLVISGTASPSGSLSINPSSVSVATSGTGSASISGSGITPPYSAQTSNSDIATASVSASTLTVRGGTTAGTATITVRDSSNPQKTATLQVTVTSGTQPPTNPTNPPSGTQRLTVTKTGTGTVTVNPQGTSCGTDCWDFSTNTPVTLTSNPDTGQFSGGCTGTGTCQVTMNSLKTVTAAFGGTTPTGTTGTITIVLKNDVGAVLQQGTVNQRLRLEFGNAPADATSFKMEMLANGIPITSGVFPPRTFTGVCPPTCSTLFTPSVAGDYIVNIYAYKNSNQEVARSTGLTFTVAAAGAAPASQCNTACASDGFGFGRCENTPLPNPQATSPAGGYGCSSNQYCNCYSTGSTTPPGTTGTGCCALKEGNAYNSENNIRTRDDCSRQGGVWGSTCDQAHNTACSQFCSGNGYGTAGACNAAGTSQYTGICLNPNTPCICTGTGQLRNTNLPCNQACSTDTRVSGGYGYGGYGYPGYSSPVVQSQSAQIPFGQCTSNPEALRFAWSAAQSTAGSATGTTGQYVREPFPLSQVPGQYQCGADQFCVCTFLNINSFSATNPSPVRNTPGSIQWDAPDAIQNPPVKQPNQRDCTVAANATITAMFAGNQTAGAGAASSTRLIQAGDSVTITGNVGKLSDQCEGYAYTCRKEKVLGCDTHNRFLWTSLSAEDCPAGTTLVNDPEEGRTANWRVIGGAALIAASFFGCDGPCMSAGISTIIDGAAAGLQCGSGRTPQSNALLYYQLLQQVQERNNQNNNQNNQGGGANLNFCCSQNDNAFCEDNSKRNTGYCIGSSVSCPNGYTKKTCPGSTNTNQNTNTGGNNNADIECVNPSEYCSLDGNCDTGSQEECWIGGTQGTCCSYSPTGGVAANPTFDVTGDVTGSNPLGSTTGPYNPSNAVGGGAGAASNAAKFSPYAIAATVALSQIPVCPSAEDQQECFSVCGSTYTTNVSAAPVCQGPVIGYQEAKYKCLPGTCGPYDGKQVKILIKGPDGSTAIDDTTTTDGNGDFSYTFIAPGADGEFTVIASVPRS